ncbi:MAG TPA: hypothetical protein DCY07_08290 [Rhodospirillaceae bacterium]|nr:hypothetical protein [Rhodospirillaceae bacterium]
MGHFSRRTSLDPTPEPAPHLMRGRDDDGNEVTKRGGVTMKVKGAQKGKITPKTPPQNGQKKAFRINDPLKFGARTCDSCLLRDAF